MSSSAGDNAFPPGFRYLVRGLQSRSDLNGTVVEAVRPSSSDDEPPEGRVAVVPVSSTESTHGAKKRQRQRKQQGPSDEEKKNVLAIKVENLIPAELEWEEEDVVPTYFEDGEVVHPKSYCGCSCYSNTKLYVFGGTEQGPPEYDDDDEGSSSSSCSEGDLGEATLGGIYSYDAAAQKWTMHWRPSLPGREEDGGMSRKTGDARADFSVGPPWREKASDGVLLHWTDVDGGQDLLIFYCSPPDKKEYAKGGCHEGAPRSFDLSYGVDFVDCVWIFRFPEIKELNCGASDFGYWVKVPTTGSKPTTFLKGKQLESENGNRDVRAEIFLDPNDDGVRIVLWGGTYWPPELEDDPVSDAQSSVAMSGIFELRIPARHLCQTSCVSEKSPSAKWSLLPQRGSVRPMVRHKHSLTRLGRDLVVLGGASIGDQPCQSPDDVGTDADLGNWAYNLDSNEWRRLAFAPFGPARRPLECISNHLAFALSDNRILVVRQYDDIYRHAQGDEDFDSIVLVYDLDNLTVHPLSTFSSSHNMRPPRDKEAIGRPLLGLGTHWFHCGICIGDGGGWRLIVHGRVTRDEKREGNNRYGISWKYNGSLYSAMLRGMGRPRYEYVERTPDWCRPGWACK